MNRYLTIRAAHGRIMIGAVTEFPPAVRQAARGAPRAQALAHLRQDAGAVSALRHWREAADLLPGSRGASDRDLVNLVERAATSQRIVLFFVPDSPPVIAFANDHDGRALEAKRVAPPNVNLPRELSAQQKADAAIAAMTKRERVLAALERSVESKHLSPELKRFMQDLIVQGALGLIAAYLVGLVVANIANPVAGLLVDSAIILFVSIQIGRAGIQALGELAEATVQAADAKDDAAISAAADVYARAIVNLGGAVFLAWLMRRLPGLSKEGGTRPTGAAAEAAPAPAPRPAPGPTVRTKVPEGPKLGTPAAESAAAKPTSYARPKGFRKGVRDEVWEKAKGSDGLVRDPYTGRVMDPAEPWDMGHKPGYEFRKHQESAIEREISRKQFLDEHNNPAKYRPELPSSNRSHRGEDMTDDYFGD